MTEPLIYALTRCAAADVSRRSSLTTIGGGVLATLASITTAAAGKKNKKKRRKNKRNKDKNQNDDGQCQSQVEQCIAIFDRACDDPSAPEDCREQTGICCESLGACQADAFLTCFLALFGIATEP